MLQNFHHCFYEDSMHKSTAWVTLIYGLFLIILGYVGYAQANSLTSFRMGSICGILIIVTAIAMFKEKIWGLYGALIFTFLLTAGFAFRYSHVGKPVPAVMTVMSGAVLLFLLTKLGKWRKD